MSEYVQQRLAEIRAEEVKPGPVQLVRSPVVIRPRYQLRIVGNGIDSHISVVDQDDLEIVDALITKLRRDLAR